MSLLRRVVLGSCAVLALGFITEAQAQPAIPMWSAGTLVNGRVYVVRFLDAEGNTQLGVAGEDLSGSNTGIQFTTTGGTTWTDAVMGKPGMNVMLSTRSASR